MSAFYFLLLLSELCLFTILVCSLECAGGSSARWPIFAASLKAISLYGPEERNVETVKVSTYFLLLKELCLFTFSVCSLGVSGKVQRYGPKCSMYPKLSALSYMCPVKSV